MSLPTWEMLTRPKTEGQTVLLNMNLSWIDDMNVTSKLQKLYC